MLMIHGNGIAILTGRVTRAGSELKTVGSKAIHLWQASALVDEMKNKDTDKYDKTYVGLKAWRDTAKRMPQLNDGDIVLATGVLARDTWTDRQGNERGGLTLTINDMDACMVIPKGTGASPAPPDLMQQAGFVPLDGEEFDGDGELPF